MWLELDIYQDIEMESTADIKKLKNFTGQREREREKESLNSWSNSIHNMIE